jgi:VWFA-related protein
LEVLVLQRRLLFLSAIFCLALSIHLPAQVTPISNQSAVPVYKTHARDVVVDVVVTRGSAEAVNGLRSQDFIVTEDGKPQAMDFFEEHTAKTLPPGALKPLPPMPPGVYTNVPPAPESDAVNVLLLDTLNTRKQDQSYVKQQILNFLKNMPPGIRVAIFTLGSKLRFVQGFTTDTTELIAALNDKKNGVSPEKDPSSHSREDTQDDKDLIAKKIMMLGGHSDGGVEAIEQSQRDFADFQYAQRTTMTLEALDALSHYLAGVPGRKNLIWFAGSFPVTIFPTASQRESMSDMRVYTSAVKKTADLLTVSKVAVYPVGAEAIMDDHPMEANHNYEQAGAGGGLLQNTMNGAAERSSQIMAMEQLAADTGGKAYYNTNDLNAAMQHAITDGSHYYTLVYSPTNKKMDGSYRRIEVKLPDSKYKLSYRRGYNADDVITNRVDSGANPLHSLMARGMPDSTQLLYGARVVPVDPQPPANAIRAGKNARLTGPTVRYSVDFMIRWTDVRLDPAPQGSHTGKLQVELLAYDHDGNALNWVGGTQAMDLKSDVYAAIQRSGVPAHFEIDVPAHSEVYLATGVYDWQTGKAGTLQIPLPSSNSSALASHNQPSTTAKPN